ncbi:hypothetical protein HBH56_188420 [Parastagonospora nodorum]|nr:hypothetical protein HBH56_188420 [Parastagonospora nodorum]QRC92241.1 hypothetical protein JI435_428050 [Parastagonospora nodorum SN15]KAH3925218.1 hypothetical protein HBH54_184230 [Parastagonospora nodorum]KAH3967819.1 hypothetical protein HBH52_184890 [Parastagonospora nodorum]KAH4131914.1 hypothetical protein HBH45_188220 [Parastagonospora nodorum]
MIQKHRERGGRLANSKDTNVRLWTYTAILEMIEAGGRMCESLVGPFKTHDIQAYQALTDIRTVEVIQGTISELEGMTRWDMRDAPNMMTRSSNRETELDADDASRVALLRAQHEEQPDKQHAELDDLADWLGGAKVGDGDGDVDMEDLATNLESFRA